MKILITGATGLIGTKLGFQLHSKGHEIVVLTRNELTAKTMLPFPATIFSYKDLIPQDALKGVDIIFNFAGASIGEKRWTTKRKDELYRSRIEFTRNLVNTIRLHIDQGNTTIKKLISVSAIGYYGDSSDLLLKENSMHGSDFLSQICIDWEKETKSLNHHIDVINPRIGIVLDKQGGALEKLLPLFRNGMGSPVGNGRQWMSWIHIDDLINMFEFLIEANVSGAVNAVAPNPVTNEEFSKILANAFDKKIFFPNVPSFILQLILGEMSTLVLSSQKVSAKKILDSGFNFKFHYLNEALTDISSNFKNNIERLEFSQWVPKKSEEIFPFFCDEKNLESITPPFLNFRVLKKDSESIKDGTLIDYQMSLHQIPFKWQTKITDWNPPSKFVDIQIKGPYKSWHHDHQLIDYSNGTLLKDIVQYELPLGLLGRLVAGVQVRSQVLEVFKYRREIIAKKFN